MFDTLDDRSGAMGTLLLPIMPDPDGLAFSQADRQQLLGVYPGLLVGPSDISGGWDLWLLNHHHHMNGED